MTLVHTLAGIAWDPEIRGILSVVAGVGVLMGSVYLLLATNLAHRLGFLLAMAAFFGWMIIHGFVWWLYPPIMGPVGRVPSWEIEELNHGDLSQALLEDARVIDTSGLPDPEVVEEATEDQIEQISAEHRGSLGDWDLLPAADASRAEAQAAADAALLEGLVPEISEPDDFVHLYVLETGGKPERESDSMVDRVTNKITNSLRPTHPPHYVIVQVQPTIPQEVEVGEPPPTPEADPDADVLSVVMIRDIGETRLPAALVTLGSALIFGLLCTMLHQRDKRVAENRAAPLPATVTTNGG
jgi:hypothetical protein